MAEPIKRPTLFVPLSVRFITGGTGTKLLERFGRDGPLVWAALLVACKENRPQGELSWASEPEIWNRLGLTGYEPDFTFDEFVAFTGRMKLTRRRDVRKTRAGRVQHVRITVWERWTKASEREADRLRKARKSQKDEPETDPEPNRNPSGTKPDLERELEREKEITPLTPLSGGNGITSLGIKELRKYTGCRATRGTHGTGYKRDPLGTDKPPPDWPHDKPTREQIEEALSGRTG